MLYAFSLGRCCTVLRNYARGEGCGPPTSAWRLRRRTMTSAVKESSRISEHERIEVPKCHDLVSSVPAGSWEQEVGSLPAEDDVRHTRKYHLDELGIHRRRVMCVCTAKRLRSPSCLKWIETL